MPARNSIGFMAEHPALTLSHSVNVLMHYYRVQHTMHVLLGKADLQPTDHHKQIISMMTDSTALVCI